MSTKEPPIDDIATFDVDEVVWERGEKPGYAWINGRLWVLGNDGEWSLSRSPPH